MEETHRKLGGAGTVAHGQGSVIAAAIVAAIGPSRVAAGVIPEDTDLLLFACEW
jgi:hypothetical protein